MSLTTSGGMTSRATLRLVAHLPDGSGRYTDYRPRGLPAPGWRRIDVRAHCHVHQTEWADALTRWHDELMDVTVAATPLAWLLQGSRIHLWQEAIRPFVFALGLLAHLREEPGGEVLAIGCPREVGEYVRELSGGSIDVVDTRSPLNVARVLFRRSVRRILEAASVLRRLRPAWRHRTPRTEVDLLMVSLALSARSVRERGDHYFGRVFDQTELRTHWLYQLGGSSERHGIEAALHASGRAVSFDHRLVSWGDVFRVLATAVHIRRKMQALSGSVPPIHIGGVISRLFARRFFRDLFLHAAPVGELILYRAMIRLVRTLSPRAVCYPYEEKGLEHALLMASALASRPIRTIGFAHSACNAGHLYLKESSIDRARPPRPDVLAASGSGFVQWLSADLGRRDVAVSVGSPRWTETSDGGRTRRRDASLRILVLTGFGYELSELGDWIEQCPSLFERCEVTIRPNPHGWHEEQRAAFARLRGASSVTVASAGSIEAQVDATDVVLFCSTSAVGEAMWRGRVAVYVELSDLWITDPLHGNADAATVPHCRTPDQLKQTLRDIAAMDEAAYARVAAAQRFLAERIYAPFDRERFCELVTGASPA